MYVCCGDSTIEQESVGQAKRICRLVLQAGDRVGSCLSPLRTGGSQCVVRLKHRAGGDGEGDRDLQPMHSVRRKNKKKGAVHLLLL